MNLRRSGKEKGGCEVTKSRLSLFMALLKCLTVVGTEYRTAGYIAIKDP